MAIHELREYDFTAENWLLYARLFTEVGFPERKHDFGRLCGAWFCDSVDVPGGVRFFHLWEYNSLDHRAELRREMMRRPRWTEDFLPQASALVHRQTLSILIPVGAPLTLSTSVEALRFSRLRATVAQASKLLSTLGAKGIARWTTEFPDPNQIIALDADSVAAEIDSSLLRADAFQEQLRITPFPLPAI